MSEVFDVRCAIDDGDMDRAVSLVRAMKNPDAQADHGRSCLHFAAWHRGTEKVIAAILECGGNVNIRSDFDGTCAETGPPFSARPAIIRRRP